MLAKRGLVSATRPSSIAVLASVAALLVTLTALSPATVTPEPRRLTVRLPGVDGQAAHIEADTLFHTIYSDFTLEDDGTEYVQTGDIPAMWLRDSSAQALPYVRFTEAIPALRPIVRDVIERDARNILTAPRANAFTSGYKVWEEKWEPDSLAYPVTLLWAYWNQTHDRTVFTPHLKWALEHVVSVYECERQHASCSPYRSRYLPNRGYGAAFSPTGMIWGAFRPSDDAVRYPFNIPQNMLAVVALEELAQLAAEGCGDRHLSAAAAQLAVTVRAGIERYGKVYDFRYGWMYAYEVDGLGDAELMDDANVPDLLSLSYFEYVSPFDPIYENTRRFSLSRDDPSYFSGRYAAGLGSPHTPTGWVWPLGMIAQALTSVDPQETAALLKTIVDTAGAEDVMHESFDPNDPSRFTRSEFGWANAMYAELLFRSVADLPYQPLHRDVFALVLPYYVATPTIDTFIEQLVAEGTLTQALRQSVM